jgi:ParB family chromosome partitioning protein
MEGRKAMAVGVERLRKAVAEKKATMDTVQLIDVDLIRRNPDQPRKHFDPVALKNLARSIREIGQIVPIIVIPITDDKFCKYELVDGERRWRACGMIKNHQHIRAFVQPPMSKDKQFMQSVVANFGRVDNNPYETALALYKIHKVMGQPIDDVAAWFTKSVSWVNQHLSLMKLHPEVIAMMDFRVPEKKRLSFSVALILTQLPQNLQLDIAKEIVAKGMRMVTAKHYIRTMAGKQGHDIAGKRPRRNRESLVSFFNRTVENADPFLKFPDGSSIEAVLSSFSYSELRTLLIKAQQCKKGIDTLSQNIEAAVVKKGKDDKTFREKMEKEKDLKKKEAQGKESQEEQKPGGKHRKKRR